MQFENSIDSIYIYYDNVEINHIIAIISFFLATRSTDKLLDHITYFT